MVFTGCGTEADNLAVLGSVRRAGGVAVCPAAEHHAVLHSVEHLQGAIGVDAAGAVDLDRLAGALDPAVRVVSVMTANNEVGTVSPLAEVVALVRARARGGGPHGRRPGLPVAGPGRGRGRLRPRCRVGPQVRWAQGRRSARRAHGRRRAHRDGWGARRDRRSGTHNVAGIVAMAAAMKATAASRDATVAHIAALRDRLLDGLLAEVDGLRETVPRIGRSPGRPTSASKAWRTKRSSSSSTARACASAASACSSGAMDPSHVLAAMGLPGDVAAGSLRLSLGWSSSDTDIDRVLEVRRPPSPGCGAAHSSAETVRS